MDASNLQVRWKHHQMGVMEYLRQLLVSEVFVDVTLCCQNRRFKAHRILLSACSSYLQQVLVEHLASDHVTIILPDIHPDDMQWLLDFMYTGSVAVPRCRLPSFLQAAEGLHIKVLTDVVQLQRGAESDSVVCIPACSPALDIKLTNLPNFQNHIINSNMDPCPMNPYDATEDFKYPTCNEEAKIPNDSPELLENKQKFKAVTVDAESCVYKCSIGNSSYAQNLLRNPSESNINSCNVTFNSPSTERTETQEGTKAEIYTEGEVSSSKDVEVVNSDRNSRIIQNSLDGNKTSLGRSSENVVLPYSEKPLRDKSRYDNKDVKGNLNSNHNASTSSSNHSGESLKMPPADRIYSKDTITPSVEGDQSEYGLNFSSSSDLHIIHKGNSKRITPNSICSEYTQDKGKIGELTLRNESRSYQEENSEHCTLYAQRFSQWPKPLPSLMPISTNYNHNGQFSPGFHIKDGKINGLITHSTRLDDLKDLLPQHSQNVKDIFSNMAPEHQTDGVIAHEGHLRAHRRVRNIWLSGRDNEMQLSGHSRPPRSLAQNIPRLSPIVPPSPWAQHHRPPCATPVALPPRGGSIGFNCHAVGCFTSKQTLSPVQRLINHAGGDRQTLHLKPSDHHLALGDAARLHPSSQAHSLNPNGNTDIRPSSLYAEYLKRLVNSDSYTGHDEATSFRKRVPEGVDMFCKLKERRLQDFYREQMMVGPRSGGSFTISKEDEVASDLTTKCPQSLEQSPHSSSPSECQKGTSLPMTMSLQQQLNPLLESKPLTCEERLLYKENEKRDDNKENSETEAKSMEISSEQSNSVSVDDANLRVTVPEKLRLEEQGYVREDCDVKILDDSKRTIFTKNDSNNNSDLLRESAQSAPIPKSHGCEDCGKFFSRRQLLVQHRRIHTGERPYSCADCGRQFTQRGHWSTHQKLHEPARRPEHACPSCGKAFVTRASLKVHLRTHTGEKPFQCGECGKQFSQLRNYKYHRSVHEGTREFAATCPECGKYFNDRGYLSSHMKIHRNRKEYGCQYCGKSFNQRVAYNMHVRIHTGERPHSCPHCNKSFSRKMLLKQHLRIHTGEKPFACSVCGKAFADRSNMTLHMRLHSGIKPYSCQLCAKAFTKKHHLKTHLNYHTGTKPYSCSKCGLRFSQSSNMRTHFKKCTSTGVTNVETPVKDAETTTAQDRDNSGAASPSCSHGGSARSTPAVITPPHSDDSSCSSADISRNAIEVQPS